MDNEAARLGFAGTVFAAFVAAWALLRGKSRSAPAETQEQINEGFKEYMARADLEREAMAVKIEGLRAYIRLLIGIMQKARLKIPPMDVIQDGFLLLPADKPPNQSHP